MALVLSFVHPLWHAKKKKKKIETRTHAWHIYTHPCIYEPLHHSSSFLYDSSNDNNDNNKKPPKRNKTEIKQTYRREWVALVGLRVPIRHWEEGAASLFPWPVQSCRRCRLSCRVCLRGFGLELNPPLPSPSLRYPVLSQMFSHSCKGQWKRFLNLCQHTGEREKEIFIIYRSNVWLMFHE